MPESLQPFVLHLDLQSVQREAVRNYLLQQGWSLSPQQPNPRVEYFLHTQPEAILLLPCRQVSDFYPRLREAFERLALVEERLPYDVARQFLPQEGQEQ